MASSSSALASLAQSYDSECDSPPPSRKRRRLPSPERELESSERRVRTFPHVKGAWATYVCVALPRTDVVESMTFEAAKALEKKTSNSKKAHRSLADARHLHITLSKTTTITYDQIEPLASALRAAFSTVQPFDVILGPKLETYVNDEGTRSFCGAVVDAPELLQTVGAVDSVMSAFGKEKYYKDPEFHCSLAWCLGSVSRGECGSLERAATFRIRSVTLRSGNKITDVPLLGEKKTSGCIL